jgi:hypothetical protein
LSFWDDYKALEDKVVAQYLASSKAENKQAIADTALNMGTLFDDPSFPINYRKQAIAEYENLLHLSDLVQDPTKLTEVGEGVFRAARPATGYGTDPRSILQSQLSIQYNAARAAGEQYFLGRNIPRLAWAQQLDTMLRDPTASAAVGSRFMVFDTETSGLATQLAGVREVSGHMMDITAKGAVHTSKLPSARFQTARMGYGSLYENGGLVPMAAHGTVGDTAFSAMTGDGDEFAKALVPMMQNSLNTDTFVGHNIGFDMEQVFVNLRQTGAYKRGKTMDINGSQIQIADLIDQAHAHIMEPGRLVDTAAMARNRVVLDAAPEMVIRGEKTAYSLENIVLQSNLIDLMRRDLGDDAVEQMFLAGSQHTADFDALLTGHLYGYLNSNQLTAGRVGGDPLGDRIRGRTLKAYAPTPVSNIANAAHIDPALFQQMLDEEPDRLRVVDMGKASGPGYMVQPHPRVYDDLIQDQTRFIMDAKITPMEQDIWRHRRDASIDFDPTAVADPLHGLGKWRSFSGVDRPYKGAFNKISTLFKHGHLPPQQDYEAFTQDLASHGNPFADLSLPERALTNALASAATQRSTVQRAISGDAAEEFATKYGDDLGMIRWAEQTKAAVNQSGAISLPMQFMQEASEQGHLTRMLAGIGQSPDNPAMLGISAFGYPTTDALGEEGIKHGVNLTYGLEGAEAHQLADWMESLQQLDIADPMRDRLREWNLTDDMLGEVASKLRDPESAKWGIGVGFLDESAGERGYSAMSDMLQNLLRDTDKIPFRTPLHSLSDGVVRTGPVVMDRLWGKDGLANLGKRVVSMGAQVSQLTSATMSQRRIVELAYGKSKLEADIAEKAVTAYHGNKGKVGIGLGITAALFGAYYMRKRRNTQEQYDETINQMPTEGGVQPAMQFVSQRRRTGSYMDTAYVPENLNNNRINHARMGTDKYNNLYSGAL